MLKSTRYAEIVYFKNYMIYNNKYRYRRLTVMNIINNPISPDPANSSFFNNPEKSIKNGDESFKNLIKKGPSNFQVLYSPLEKKDKGIIDFYDSSEAAKKISSGDLKRDQLHPFIFSKEDGSPVLYNVEKNLEDLSNCKMRVFQKGKKTEILDFSVVQRRSISKVNYLSMVDTADRVLDFALLLLDEIKKREKKEAEKRVLAEKERRRSAGRKKNWNKMQSEHVFAKIKEQLGKHRLIQVVFLQILIQKTNSRQKKADLKKLTATVLF